MCSNVEALKIKFKDGYLEVFPKEASQDLKLFKRKEDVEAAYETVRLDGMRSRRSWQKRKERAAKKVWAVASDLVAMYAERQQLTREPCRPDAETPMAAFEAAFSAIAARGDLLFDGAPSGSSSVADSSS